MIAPCQNLAERGRIGEEPSICIPFPRPSSHNLIHLPATRSIMRSILPLISLSALLAPVQSLYFYIDGTTPKCFFEELPKDTLVVGHYTAEEYDENTKIWSKHDGLNILIHVDVNTPSPPLPSLQNMLIPTPGSLRQQPPSNFSKRLLGRSLHLHSCRLGRPQDLLYAPVDIRGLRLALGVAPDGRYQVDAGFGNWGDERYREYG